MHFSVQSHFSGPIKFVTAKIFFYSRTKKYIQSITTIIHIPNSTSKLCSKKIFFLKNWQKTKTLLRKTHTPASVPADPSKIKKLGTQGVKSIPRPQAVTQGGRNWNPNPPKHNISRILTLVLFSIRTLLLSFNIFFCFSLNANKKPVLTVKNISTKNLFCYFGTFLSPKKRTLFLQLKKLFSILTF